MASSFLKLSVLTIFLGVLLAFLWYNLGSSLAMRPEAAKAALAAGLFDAVVDVRSDTEWSFGHYPLAIHIPIQHLKEDLPQRVPNKKAKILFYCNTSTRSRMAAETAQSLGYTNVRYLLGTHLNLL